MHHILANFRLDDSVLHRQKKQQFQTFQIFQDDQESLSLAENGSISEMSNL